MALFTKQHILLLFLLILIAAKAASERKPDCSRKCGSLNIPYPFGTSEGCYLDDSFFINCTHNSRTPRSPTPFLQPSNLNVLSISLEGEIIISFPVVHDCYGMEDNDFSTDEERIGRLNLTHFFISSTKNKFTVLGCDTVGEFWGYVPQGKSYAAIAACASICNSLDDIRTNGSCSGIGCCQTPIPEGISAFAIETWNQDNHSMIHYSNPCSHAFVVEEAAYNFLTTDLKKFKNETVPIVLDWAVGNQTCEDAKHNVTSYACKAENSDCYNSTNGVGYRCKCLSGFQGNPYLYDGCEDIDECNMEPKPCSRTCENVPGSFKCSCPKEFEGDGMSNGTGCHHKSLGNLTVIIALSVSLSLLALLVGSLYLYSILWKRKLDKIRQNYFLQNGGQLLQQQIVGDRGSAERATIFTAQELKKATNNFDEARVIGKGGHGTVYKGILSNSEVVAIKKSRISNQSEIEQFINELVVLSRINHDNVVKLLGCCLETEVPLLVYEFITNGTLSNHLHVEGRASQLSWTIRLRIATEIAKALAYLHSAASSTPIIHRDVKTANILLDDNFTAKVSDFGASKLFPLDETQLTTLVQGTLGYLDLEYFQTSQLTEKSDVYSFGVVLAELLTGKTALSFDRAENNRNLSMYFVSSMQEGRLPQILDNNIVNDANVEQMIEVANLTKRCLMLKGEERPTMKEVAMELQGLRSVERLSLGASNVSEEETEYLLKVPAAFNIIGSGDDIGCSSIMTGFDSLQNQILAPLGDGR